MSDDPRLPALPWHYETTALVGHADGSGHVYLCDANGKKIGTIWGPAEQKVVVANFIVAASAAVDGKPVAIVEIPSAYTLLSKDRVKEMELARLLKEGAAIWTTDEAKLVKPLGEQMDEWVTRVRATLAQPVEVAA